MIDLSRQLEPLSERLQAAASEVIRSGWYLFGSRTSEFEKAFAEWLGRKHCATCGNGTDAIALAIEAAGVAAGSDVVTVPNTAFPTACAITMAGCRPVFVDIDPRTWMLDTDAAAEAAEAGAAAVIPVHLYGHMADMEALSAALPGHVIVIEDCAQSHGATLGGKKAGTFSDISAFSFYPSKNLCALGDAGAVASDNAGHIGKARELRFYGQEQRDHHTAIGRNSRIDEIQAAMLLVELESLDSWNSRRREIAAVYSSQLDPEVFRRPSIAPGTEPSYHLYVIRVEERDALRSFLDSKGIDTGIHYPVPIHCQPAYGHLGYSRGDFPESEALAAEIVSLPVAPHLDDSEVERVVEACREFSGAGGD